MKYYEIDIAGLKRQLPLCPLNDELYIAGFVMFGDTEITIKCAEELLKQAPEFDVIVTAESKGIPLAYEMSRQSERPYVVLRKTPKLYMFDIIKTDVKSITTASPQVLCVGSVDAEIIRGKRILVVDDVVSTGGSLVAIEDLVGKCGGNIVSRMAVLAEGDAIKRDDLIYLQKLYLFNEDGEPIKD